MESGDKPSVPVVNRDLSDVVLIPGQPHDGEYDVLICVIDGNLDAEATQIWVDWANDAGLDNGWSFRCMSVVSEKEGLVLGAMALEHIRGAILSNLSVGVFSPTSLGAAIAVVAGYNVIFRAKTGEEALKDVYENYLQDYEETKSGPFLLIMNRVVTAELRASISAFEIKRDGARKVIGPLSITSFNKFQMLAKKRECYYNSLEDEYTEESYYEASVGHESPGLGEGLKSSSKMTDSSRMTEDRSTASVAEFAGSTAASLRLPLKEKIDNKKEIGIPLLSPSGGLPSPDCPVSIDTVRAVETEKGTRRGSVLSQAGIGPESARSRMSSKSRKTHHKAAVPSSSWTEQLSGTNNLTPRQTSKYTMPPLQRNQIFIPNTHVVSPRNIHPKNTRSHRGAKVSSASIASLVNSPLSAQDPYAYLKQSNASLIMSHGTKGTRSDSASISERPFQRQTPQYGHFHSGTLSRREPTEVTLIPHDTKIKKPRVWSKQSLDHEAIDSGYGNVPRLGNQMSMSSTVIMPYKGIRNKAWMETPFQGYSPVDTKDFDHPKHRKRRVKKHNEEPDEDTRKAHPKKNRVCTTPNNDTRFQKPSQKPAQPKGQRWMCL